MTVADWHCRPYYDKIPLYGIPTFASKC